MSHGGRGHSYFGRGQDNYSDPDYRSRSRERSVVSSHSVFSKKSDNYLNSNNSRSAASPERSAPPRVGLSSTFITKRLPPKMVNTTAVVKELLAEKFGILENLNESWLCFFATTELMSSKHGGQLGELLPPGTRVGLNAQLIDEDKKIQVNCH